MSDWEVMVRGGSEVVARCAPLALRHGDALHALPARHRQILIFLPPAEHAPGG